MNIAFDFNGKVMQVKKRDPGSFANLGTKGAKTELNNDLTEVVHSDIYSRLQKMKEERGGG